MSEEIWHFVVDILGPDLKWRDPVTGTLDLESGNLNTHGELLPTEISDELRQFEPGVHEGNQWSVNVGQFVHRIRFDKLN